MVSGAWEPSHKGNAKRNPLLRCRARSPEVADKNLKKGIMAREGRATPPAGCPRGTNCRQDPTHADALPILHPASGPFGGADPGRITGVWRGGLRFGMQAALPDGQCDDRAPLAEVAALS